MTDTNKQSEKLDMREELFKLYSKTGAAKENAFILYMKADPRFKDLELSAKENYEGACKAHNDAFAMLVKYCLTH